MSTAISTDTVPNTSEPPRIFAPPASLFADRARRFAALAEGHALGDWLRFMGRLAEAQHRARQNLATIALPEAAALARARSHGMPPLPAQHLARDPVWRQILAQLAAALSIDAPASVRDALDLLQSAPPAALEALADRVLRTELYGEDATLLPFVAAALQVYWTAMAGALSETGIPPLDVPGVCPCCGSLPVTSVLRNAGEVSRLRYLHCSLCNTEWNLVRVKCAACDSTAGIAYRELEGSVPVSARAMRAETCDECRSYLKILDLEQAPGGDPVADDLASLTLDLLLDEAGYARAGPNLLFVPGDG